jgi:para-aminobenzoate synthetase component 1
MHDPRHDWWFGPGFGGGEGLVLSRPAGALTLDRSSLPGDDAVARLLAFCEHVPADGAIGGYIGYEFAGALEDTLDLPASPDGLPVLHLVRFDACRPGGPPAADAEPVAEARHGGETALAYAGKVRSVIESIRRGDAFQVNISHRLSARFRDGADLPRALFARLVGDRPAAYAAYLPMRAGAVLSNSPELFLDITDRQVVAEPVKGTRPRGATGREDEALAAALLDSTKDRAENIMIADLLRNDLAKVCEDGSIAEPAICALRTLPSVHHLYSRITGRLREGVPPMAALLACFPCGSVTGAPKFRAMQIIADLEGEGRGPYCGAILLLRPGGRLTASVPIRTGVLSVEGEAARLDVRTGGGVTVLSDPQEEYEETVAKAYPFEAMTR